MELSILIPTISSRKSVLSRLLHTLEPQICYDMEILVHEGDHLGVGDKCNKMFREARGRLVVSIDDDDNVPDDFVESIMDTLDVRPDFVGYRTAYSRNGEYQYDIYQDARPDATLDDTHRHVSLKNPIARDIARQFDFTNQHGGDMIWCNQVYNSGLIKNPIFIDKVLYFYDFWDAHTVGPAPENQKPPQRDLGLFSFDRDKFRWFE